MFEYDFMGPAPSPVFALGCIALAVAVVGWALLTAKGARAAYRWWTAPVPPCPVAAVILDKMETVKCTSKHETLMVGDLTIYVDSGNVWSSGSYLHSMMTRHGLAAVLARARDIHKRLYEVHKREILNNALDSVDRKPDVCYRGGLIYVNGKARG